MSWEQHVRRVTPYVAGEQPKDSNIIKLNTNESPFPPAPGVTSALEALAARSEKFRLYLLVYSLQVPLLPALLP